MRKILKKIEISLESFRKESSIPDTSFFDKDSAEKQC